MQLTTINLKNTIVFIILIINALFLSSCNSQKQTIAEAEKPTTKIQLPEKEVIDSSFSGFLSHFKEIKLPHEVKFINDTFGVNSDYNTIQEEYANPQELIADYYIRSFLMKDSTGVIEPYLLQYKKILQDKHPWFYLKYGEKFSINPMEKSRRFMKKETKIL